MDMNADLLASLRCTKDPDDRDFNPIILARGRIPVKQGRVEIRRGRLIMIHAIEAHLEGFHCVLLRRHKAVTNIAIQRQ